MGRGFPWLPVIVIALVLVGTFITVSMNFGFWLDTQNVKHQGKVGVIQASQNYDITQHSKAYQDAQIAIVNQRIGDILGNGGLAAQRAGIAAGSGLQESMKASELDVINHMCAAAQNIEPNNAGFTSGNPSDAQITAANCVGGQAVSDPPLARNPVPHGGT